MAKSVLVCCPCPWDSTSWYRGVHPFSRMGVRMGVAGGELDWTTMDPYEVLFMQRPFDEEHLGIVRMGKELGKKIWVDHDDLIFDVPKTNPNSWQFKRGVIEEILKLADVVTVSTEPLQKEMGGVVVKNAWDYVAWPERMGENPVETWLWRGSDMHWQDLEEFYPKMDLSKRWVFMGFAPLVRDRIKDLTIHRFLPILDYFRVLRETNPTHQVIPLKDTKFNRCKSNVAWMEGYMAGARNFYAPDWYEVPEKPLDLVFENLKRLKILESL